MRQGHHVGMRYALVLVLLVLAGCRSVGSEGATDTRTIQVDGRERTFRVYTPPGIGDHAALVVMMHGGFGSGTQAQRAYGWDALADREGFIVAYPDGLNRAWNVGGGCCGQPGRTNVNDVAFLEQMVAGVKGIDPERVYATGMSNGAMMSYRLGCDSKVFAAIGPVAGTLLGECSAPAPIPVIHVHGLKDTNVRFDGQPGSGVAGIDGPPIAEVVKLWQDNGGGDVNLVTVADAGHEWPDGTTEKVWAFFQANAK
jgi:polyhydroxybutyrate depolymerase